MRFVYLLHSGQLFGTERMALATLNALRDRVDAAVLAPAGPVHGLARDMGIRSRSITGVASLLRELSAELRGQPDATVLATGVVHSIAAAMLRLPLRWHGSHLHVVHGGTDERLSYGRKRWLAPLDLTFVAVSEFVRERLLAHGVAADRVEVAHNFLHDQPAAQREPFCRDGVRRVIVLSRLDRIKRLHLLFDALERTPGLEDLQFDVYGTGELQDELSQRAARQPQVRLHGFDPHAASRLADADLMLHTCPEEPFGLVMLEAFAAGVPVLAPNAGGAAILVEEGVCGYHFTANDARALGQALLRLRQEPAQRLQAMADGGRRALVQRFDPRSKAETYLRLAGASA